MKQSSGKFDTNGKNYTDIPSHSEQAIGKTTTHTMEQRTSFFLVVSFLLIISIPITDL